jgi:hypothetical protein
MHEISMLYWHTGLGYTIPCTQAASGKGTCLS